MHHDVRPEKDGRPQGRSLSERSTRAGAVRKGEVVGARASRMAYRPHRRSPCRARSGWSDSRFLRSRHPFANTPGDTTVGTASPKAVRPDRVTKASAGGQKTRSSNSTTPAHTSGKRLPAGLLMAGARKGDCPRVARLKKIASRGSDFRPFAGTYWIRRPFCPRGNGRGWELKESRMWLMGSPDGGQDVGWASRRTGRAGSSDMSGLLAFGVVFGSFPDGLRSEQ